MTDTEPAIAGHEDARRLVATIGLQRYLALAWILVAVVAFLGAAYVFAFVLEAVRGNSLEPISISVSAIPGPVGIFFLALSVLVFVVGPHELIHALTMRYYGGQPTYGVGLSHLVLPYAYVRTETVSYSRNQMLVIVLAPFVTLSLVGLALALSGLVPSSLLVFLLAANAAGSTGDFWIALQLWHYPASVHVGDVPATRDGQLGIYAHPTATLEHRPLARTLSRVAVGTVGTLTLLVGSLLGLVFASLAFDSGTVIVGDPASNWFLLRHEVDGHRHRVELEVGGRLLLALAVLGGCVMAAGSHLVTRSSP